jgi:hypothetical protein
MIRHFLQTVIYLKHSRCGHHIFSLSAVWSVEAVSVMGAEVNFFIAVSLCHFYLRPVQQGRGRQHAGTEEKLIP